MSPADFLAKWTPRDHTRVAFIADLALLITREQDRVRRQLTTDRRAYEAAVAETARELERQGAARA
jgi:hypothetical protein